MCVRAESVDCYLQYVRHITYTQMYRNDVVADQTSTQIIPVRLMFRTIYADNDLTYLNSRASRSSIAEL